MVRIQAEVVNGKCPTCDEFTTLVGLDKAFYRCMGFDADLEQHVNGTPPSLRAVITGK